MTVDHARAAEFHRLHSSGCFVMPNPWDVGSARVLERMDFPALATTSAGFAWTLGRSDGWATRDEVLEHLSAELLGDPGVGARVRDGEQTGQGASVALMSAVRVLGAQLLRQLRPLLAKPKDDRLARHPQRREVSCPIWTPAGASPPFGHSLPQRGPRNAVDCAPRALRSRIAEASIFADG
jgi:hypothetical protein